MITDREKLEFESLPEFVREPRPARETYASKTAAAPSPIYNPIPQLATPAPPAPVSAPQEGAREPQAALPKSAELETLWPGVSHEFFHAAPRKGPSFYLTIGFALGALVSWLGVFGYSAVSHLASNTAPGKEILVAQSQQPGHATESGAAVSPTPADGETIVPLSAIYQVASGDTLAGIALKNYHRATPRLLDEICRANNMRNANVLNLGQKLSLPEYHPQSRQIATGGSQVTQ